MEKTTPGQNEVSYWDKQVKLALKREEKWRKAAREVVKLYEQEIDRESSFNILYSNTETLLPALYSALPRPVIKRRYADADPLGKAVSEVVKRSLSYFMDSPTAEYTPFNQLMKDAVLGGLVPGRGVTRFAYDADIDGEEKAPDPSQDDNQDSENVGDVSESNELPEGPKGGKVTGEYLCGTNLPYNQLVYGNARRWSDVPWCGYMHLMTRADVGANLGPQWVNKLTYMQPTKSTLDEEEDQKRDTEETRSQGMAGVVEVWEIWHKSRKSVIFFAPSYKDAVLKRMPVPLKLSGFFNHPAPLQFMAKVSTLTPTALYSMYRAQAKELNRVNVRINKITDSLKVRGFYDARLKDLANLLNRDDNTLIPAEGMVAFQQDGAGMDRMIWMVPLEKLSATLQQLYLARENIKNVIYEITGISDILRGSSVASETATAQTIKNQWGTLRLKSSQKVVAEYVRQCLRIMAEIIADNFSQESLAAITQLDFATDQQVQQATMIQQQTQQVMQAMQQMQQQAPPAQPPMPGQPPAPPQQPQIPPQLQSQIQALQPQMQMAQAIMAKPKWSDVMQVLRDDFVRGYHIDVETNSTILADATEDKQDLTELMTAIGQLVQSFGGLVQQGQLPVGALKAMLLVCARRFQFGEEIEDELSKMAEQMPQQQGPDPKVQGQMQLLQIEVGVKQQQADIDKQLMQAKLQVEQAKLDLERQKIAMQREKLGIDQQTAQMKAAATVNEVQINAQARQQEMALDAQDRQSESQATQAQHAMGLQQAQETHQARLEQAAQVAASKPKKGN